MSTTATHDTTRTTRLTAALSLIAFPTLIVASSHFDHLRGSTAERVQAMAQHAGDQALHSALMYASALFTFVAVFAIGRLALRHTPKLTRGAMTLGVIGGGGHVVLATYGAIASFTGAGDPQAMIAFLDRVDNGSAILPLAIGIFLFGPAMVLLTIALYRARVVGRISVVAMLAAFAVHMLPVDLLNRQLDVPNVLLALVFVALGVRIARTTDADFERGVIAPLNGPKEVQAAAQPVG